ncbi:MAG: hypothetical protein WDN47_03225 [Candidatus Doudnabacteria bacterium]
MKKITKIAILATFLSFAAITAEAQVSSLSITTPSALPSAQVGTLYSTNIGFTGTALGFSTSITNGSLPAGISVGAGPDLQSVTLFGIPTTAGAYNFTLNVLYNSQTASKPFSLTVNANGVSGVVGPAHLDNTNILGTDGTVYRLQSAHRSPYTSAGAFLSYGFNNWQAVMPATTGDMSLPLTIYTPTGSNTSATYYIPPRNGSLINDQGTIYLITNGYRTGFTTPTAFLGLGYKFENAASGDTSFMVTLPPIALSSIPHPDGTLINDTGTIYLQKSSNRVGIPSMAVFNSWGFKLGEVVPANSLDRLIPQGGTISTRQDDQLNI